MIVECSRQAFPFGFRASDFGRRAFTLPRQLNLPQLIRGIMLGHDRRRLTPAPHHRVGFCCFSRCSRWPFCSRFWSRAEFRPGALRVIGPVADFTLTNQDGQATSLADLTNHVWVADIIFTRCAGPCPRMTGQMRSLQALLPKRTATPGW